MKWPFHPASDRPSTARPRMPPSSRYRRFVHHALRGVATAGFLTALLSPLPSGAQSRYSPSLAAMLPAYCKQDITGVHYTAEERERWNAILGGGVENIHHYCRGLNW